MKDGAGAGAEREMSMAQDAKQERGSWEFNDAAKPELSPWNLEGCATFRVYADGPQNSLKTLFREETVVQPCHAHPISAKQK